MKITLVSFFLILFLSVYSQYSIYPASDPRSFYVDAGFIAKHSIASCQSASYSRSKFMGSGIPYLDSLGRSYCFESFDSKGRISYTGNYYYDSDLLKPKKFIGVSHYFGGRYEENFYPVYEQGY